MNETILFQTSIIAAFLAGMVALFAPCCVSYLLPAYLGSVFKERKRVLFMTLVYSLGIFVVMIPAVLGSKLISLAVFRYHEQIYLLAGLFMILVGITSLLGLKLPMPRVERSGKQGTDVASVFTLGVFSGITSACCAPVLVGVLTLSFLSPSLWQALLIGFVYVLGMVAPLYIGSYFLDSKKVLGAAFFKNKLGKIKIFSKVYPIIVGNVISFLIFTLTGILVVYLTLATDFSMAELARGFSEGVNRTALWLDRIPGLDIIFLGTIAVFLFSIIKKALSPGQGSFVGGADKENGDGSYYTCPMHLEVRQDNPGRCPKCGMDLVKGDSDMDHDNHAHSGHKHHDHNEHHDHTSMMASPEAASDFLRRFFIVTVLLVPLAVFSELAVKFLGVPDFTLRPLLEFGIGTIIFYFGLVFFQHAKHEIMSRQYGMMTLVSLGVGAGYLFSALSTFIPALQAEFYLEISTLIWVLLFGHFLEAKSSAAAGDALQEVAKLLPREAHLKVGDRIKDVDITSLNEGNVVVVKPGEKVPADGEIIKGGGNFDEAHITGESKPVEKDVGGQVVAGSISIDGSVEVRLVRVGESSTIGQIQSLIASAKQTKPSAQKLADRASKWLTFSALAVSFVTLIIWSVIVGETVVFAATLAITVLVIACPHALGLAIPAVSTIATKLAVNNGVFIKDMVKIEVAKRVDYVVLDKTGTLTRGELGVTDVKVVDGNESELLSIAGGIESHSSHVIGMAIVKYCEERGISFGKAGNVKNLPGRGMEAVIGDVRYFVGNQRLMEEKSLGSPEAGKIIDEFSKEGKTPVFVASEEVILGIIGLSDQIKDESFQAVEELHKLGVKVAMLTGDTEAVAEKIARQLGIDSVFAEVLPEDKYKYIKKLQDQGNVVLMAGDGVNDAPALTQADVGVAIGAGTDVAVEAGDIILTQSNPQHIVRLIVLSRKVYRKMVENLFWAVGYNVLAIPAAAGLLIPLGFRLTPAVGALLMSLSSVIVVINAMTLRKAKLQL